jgi:N-acetylmuramic acid 6-phosphate etherase
MTFSRLTTESRNPASEGIDGLSPLEIVHLMNAEDATVAEAVGREAVAIARAIETVATKLAAGGRLIYLGAGTSGRMGMLDAAECPPTFNSPPGQVVGIIAGGPAAMQRSVEGAEDSREAAAEDLRKVDLSARRAIAGGAAIAGAEHETDCRRARAGIRGADPGAAGYVARGCGSSRSDAMMVAVGFNPRSAIPVFSSVA